MTTSIWYVKAWFRNLWSVDAILTILSSFGALWLVIEITTFFAQGTQLPERIRAAWPAFLLVGSLLAIGRRYPRLRVECKLSGRDVTIGIVVGDIFSLPGALIVGSNATFDTRISSTLISERSVQGAFTKKYYQDEQQLDAELAARLNAIQSTQLTGPREGKSLEYPIGTCVRLNPKDRTGYFLAICRINEHGNASGTFEDVRAGLDRLWSFIAARGTREPLVMPVLGTGFARVTQTREEVIRETIRSFVAACSEVISTDRLTIVITPKDVVSHRISLDELGSFLQHECKYRVFANTTQQAVGTPIG
jgi:hypothetical protein